MTVRFEVTDGNCAVMVAYTGLLPDLFREGQGVVAEGALESAGLFKAVSVLAKHDEKLHAQRGRDALKKQGYWEDESTSHRLARYKERQSDVQHP
jgi:cytochrome c-type biogenesis protein CcmE